MATYTRTSGTTATLSTTVGAMTAGATVAAAGTLTLSGLTPANTPDGFFTLAITFATSTGIENKYVELLARTMNIQSTNDADVPTSTFREKLIGRFKLKNVTSEQFSMCAVNDLPPESDLYLFVPTEVGQNSSANAKLYFTPYVRTVA